MQMETKEIWGNNTNKRQIRLWNRPYNKRQRKVLYTDKGINIKGYNIH